MNNAKQHWKILQELGDDLANRVQEFMVLFWNGNGGTMVVTEHRELYWLRKICIHKNWKTTVVTKLNLLDVREVIQMAQGATHILLLNKRGEIYSMGGNHRGQLGLGTLDLKNTQTLKPQLITIPSQHKVVISVRCSSEHCLALTEDGKVLAWGGNHAGQVGDLIRSLPYPYPKQIHSVLNHHRVVAIECGECHSLALTDQGVVYAWGCNLYGQLGNGSETGSFIPIEIDTPSPVKSMAAGRYHTLLLTETGEVWACGDNEYGQVGLSSATRTSPRLVKVEGLPLISHISSQPSTNLSAAMSLGMRCFVWGQFRSGVKCNYIPKELPPEFLTVEFALSLSCYSNYTPHSVTISETLPLTGLYARISRMFDNPETSSDVQFVVEQRTIHVHRNILGNSSDYFAGMFSKRWLTPVDPEDPIVRVTITDHSYPVFYAFLRFLYTDSLEVHFDLLPDLFELASLYLVPEIQQLCLSRMRITITPGTCCLYYQLTHRHSQLPEVVTFQQELVQFVSTQMSEIVETTAAYQSMEPDLRDQLTNSVRNFDPESLI